MFLANWSLTLCLFPAAARSRKRGGSSCPQPPIPFLPPGSCGSEVLLIGRARCLSRKTLGHVDHLRLLSRNILRASCLQGLRSTLFQAGIKNIPTETLGRRQQSAGPVAVAPRAIVSLCLPGSGPNWFSEPHCVEAGTQIHKETMTSCNRSAAS